MRKEKQQYIHNLVRQLLGQYCIMESEAVTRNIKERRLQDMCMPIAPSGITTLIFKDMDTGHLNVNNVASYFHKALTSMVGKMKQPATLGKIVAHGLSHGEGDGASFRKTSYHNYWEAPHRLMHAIPNGRTLMEHVSIAVLAAATWDYLEVLRIAKDQNITWSEAGKEYFESFVTQSRTFENSFVRSVVGTGP